MNLHKRLQPLIFALVLMLSIGVVSVSAQDNAPSQIQFALEALSQRVGQSVAIEDLDGWSWEQTQYPDTSLGCPQPDQAYAQVLTSGYQFELIYQGQLYDYRVSEDGSIVIFCQEATVPTPTTVVSTAVPATVVPDTPPTQAPADVCVDALPVRLSVGQTARATAGLASNVRSAPSIDADVVGEMQPGETFQVLDGPVCSANGLYWWQIQGTNGLSGWIAQGQDGLYYVEPIPQLLPAETDLDELNMTTVPNLVQLSEVQGNLTGTMAWSPDGSLIAVANSNVVQPGVWLYSTRALDALPRRFVTQNPVTAVGFTADGALLITGDDAGVIRYWDLNSGKVAYEFDAHTSPVRALSLSPNGRILASVDSNLTIRLWGVPTTPAG